MENSKIIIAIDGYSSTGKSSFAKLIARKLGYIYIDTGAMYRAVTYFAYSCGFIDNRCKIKEDWLKKAIGGVRISFKQSGEDGKSETYLNDVNVEKQIRSMEISNKVSHISALPFVRSFIDGILRDLGERKGVVMDGRDIGTAVFPNAELKLFMTASPQVRAERRYRELQEKGGKETLEQVFKNLEERDYIDTHRETAPLTKAADALLLDNSNMTIEQQLEWLDSIMKERFSFGLFEEDRA
ncbi:MAG: (d)CMP kinase [Bacteroidales bacterium]|nr:(d)CMP kinase [Bacteroidales bacterium]